MARFWLTKRVPRMCGKQVEADGRKIAPMTFPAYFPLGPPKSIDRHSEKVGTVKPKTGYDLPAASLIPPQTGEQIVIPFATCGEKGIASAIVYE